MSSLLKAARLTSITLGITLALVEMGSAQFANGAKTVSAGPSGSASASGPVGPGLSRLPTTTPSVVPYALSLIHI